MERHNEISEFIWGIKEHIRDEYKEKEYEEVILPFTLGEDAANGWPYSLMKFSMAED